MNSVLQLTITGFSNLEEHGEKPDGTPDIRLVQGYKIEVTRDRRLILWEEVLSKEKIPVDPTKYLAERLRRVLETYLPQIEPQ